MNLSLIVSRAIFSLGVLGSVSICAQAQELTIQTQEINARQVSQNNSSITIYDESQLKDYFDIEIDSSRDATNTAKTVDSKNETYLSGNVGIKYRF